MKEEEEEIKENGDKRFTTCESLRHNIIFRAKFSLPH
jgi:hypothetical protein